MGYRSFLDERGVDWQAWDVIPALSDRRLHDRRVMQVKTPVERRRAVDRRVVSGRRPTLSAGLGTGWLCFETTNEEQKRRLSPIPSDWLSCAIDVIRKYLAMAKPATRMTPATAKIAIRSDR